MPVAGKTGAEFLVNTQTANSQLEPSITALSADSFVVIWRDESGLGGDADTSVKGQMFSVVGDEPQAVGPEFLVNTTTANPQNDPSVTALSADSFVVTWTAPTRWPVPRARR